MRSRNIKVNEVLIDYRNVKGVDHVRPRVDRVSIFKMLALNWERKKIKKEGKISEATFWRIKAEYSRLSEGRKAEIKSVVLEEGKAKAKFEDYEFVQHWVVRMRSGTKSIKSWKKRFNACRRVWLLLQKKNPQNWTIEDIELRALPVLRERVPRAINHYLTALRSLRPDFKFPDITGEVLGTERKPEPTFEWKKIYERIMEGEKLDLFLRAGGFKPELVKRLHVTLGCREGTTGEGGILGLEWNRVNWSKRTIDVYEGKTGGGFYWLDCPLDLFGDRAFEMLQQYWIEQGKPEEGKMFHDVSYAKKKGNGGLYLTEIYEEASEAIGEKYGRGGITPHFADKLHASLLIDADVPLEMVAGDKPYGIMGRGWEDLSTLKKYYLAFRKRKVRENRMKARKVMCD